MTLTLGLRRSRMRRLRPLPALVVVAAVTLPASAHAAVPHSLPTVNSGARPGPDVLYDAAPDAPQLENRHPRFRAPMLRVAATEAYTYGEFLHTDYLYDDYGADTNGQRSSSLGDRAGDVDYPSDEKYGGNAADIVEVRIAPGDDDVMYRLTLNTLKRSDTTILALAFDTDRDAATGHSTLPRDPGAPFPGTDEVITVWGTGAEHARLAAGEDPVTTPVDVSTDLEANQMTVTVPRSVSDPAGTWRTTVAAGVYDSDSGGWRETGGPNGIYNLAFRYDEPIQNSNNPPDVNQSGALADDDPTRYARDIDFDKLAAGDNSSTVPRHGLQIRMFPSRLELGEGRNLDQFPAYLGQLQPYAVYIPRAHRPNNPVGLTLSLHSLGQKYWQYNGGQTFPQFGEQRDNIVLSPMARGPDGWYQHAAEYDVFEGWNDLARHFSLDSRRAYVWGYSMGGYGTYRLGGLYPDLFTTAVTVVGPPGDGIWVPPRPPTGGADTLSNLWLENVRNIPYMNIAAGEDELVPIAGPRAQNLGAPEFDIRGFEQLGYRYRFLVFPAAEHFTLALLGYDLPEARDHLGGASVDRNPAHVSFAYVPASDDRELGLVHDHAYWVSDVRLADAEGETAKGVVDVRSRAFGEGDPASEETQGGGVMQLPYVETGRRWQQAPAVAKQNVLDLDLQNVKSTTIDTRRAGLNTGNAVTIEGKSDGDGTVRLDGAFPPGSRVTIDGEPAAGSRVDAAGVTVPLQKGSHTYVVSAGRHASDRADVARRGVGGDQDASSAVAGVDESRAATLPATGGVSALSLLGLVLLGGGAGVARRQVRR